MKITIKKSLQGLLLVPALALGVSVLVPVAPVAQAQLQSGINAAGGTGKTESLDLAGTITWAVNLFLMIVGAAAVVMIIYGGFKYITSAGDSSGVTSAKNTILYAVLGLIVVLLAYAIVNWVINDLIANVTT